MVVIVVAFAAAALLILYRVRSLIYMLFLATFVAIALEPAVQGLVRRRWKRQRATMLVFGISMILFVGFFVALIPVFVAQAAGIADAAAHHLAVGHVR